MIHHSKFPATNAVPGVRSRRPSVIGEQAGVPYGIMISPPSEYSAIIGDSKLLCVLAGTGEIRRLFWPHIDYGQHVEQFKIALQIQGMSEILWLADPGWIRSQSYDERANNVVTLGTHKRRRVSTSSSAFSLPGSDSV